MKAPLSCLLAPLLLGILLPVSFLAGCTSPTPPVAASVSCWSRLELTFTSSAGYGNPAQDTTLRAEFKSPSGQVRRVDGFWDGGATWRVRFMPDETGPWTWATEFSARDNPGLHSQRGALHCTANPQASPPPGEGDWVLRLTAND